MKGGKSLQNKTATQRKEDFFIFINKWALDIKQSKLKLTKNQTIATSTC